MNILKEIKSNTLFIILTLTIVGFYTFMAVTGSAFWDSSGVERNTANRGVISHSGYGARFYHK